MNLLAVIRRAFSGNLNTIALTGAEQSALQADGLTDPTLQRYAIWRRATITMVLLATLLSAGVAVYRTLTEPEDQPDVMESITEEIMENLGGAEAADDATPDPAANEDEEEDEPQTAFSLFEEAVHLVSLWILPLAAFLALLLRNKFRLSYRILVAAFVFSFFVPIFFALCPWSWWGYEEPVISAGQDPQGYMLDMIEGILEGAGYLAMLLPAVLSLVPGVLKGCLRVKTLLPESLLPGWFIVVVAPFYGLFLLVVFVAVDQVTSDPVFIAVMVLLILAHMVYAFRADAFTRPLLSDEDYARMANVQRVVGILMALVGLTVVAALATRNVMGVSFVGLDPEKSLMRPIELAEFVLEFIGRAMFVTALGADFFMRMSLVAWKHGKSLEGTAAAKSHDDAMGAMERAVK